MHTWVCVCVLAADLTPNFTISDEQKLAICHVPETVRESLYVLQKDRLESPKQPISAILGRSFVFLLIKCKGVVNSAIRTKKLRILLLNTVFQNSYMTGNF